MTKSSFSAAASIAIAAMSLSPSSFAQTGTVSVDARSSVFSQALYPVGSWDGSSLSGVVISLTPGAGRVLTLPSVTGLIDPNHNLHGADGGYYDGTGININSYGSISGVIDSLDRTLALMGVFLTASPAPAGSAPARLDFTGNHGFSSLAPLLNQSFFIGDGLTGTGVGNLQEFIIPDGAAYLQLGFADACCSAFVGTPGYYGDNHGSLSVQYDVTAAAVPEPATLALTLAGLGLAGLRRRRLFGGF